MLYFNGRSRRSELWWFFLFNIIIEIIIIILANLITPNLIFLLYIYALIAFLPGLGLVIRRLHDIGKSGWYIFIAFIPLVGAFILLYFYCLDSENQSNEYGESPKYGKNTSLV
jgi:uncharacterized membrane protein YhaH (DUF805 family)